MTKNFLATRWGIIGVGGIIGVFAALLQKLGIPETWVSAWHALKETSQVR